MPPSTFSMTNVDEWDNFRSIDMDKEVVVFYIFLHIKLYAFVMH